MNHPKTIPKILIVDDHPENLVVLEKLLQPLGVAAYKATSGNQALSLILEHEFALGLLDVQMPEMDGYELLETMLLDERSAHIPIIFITANHRDEAHRMKGYQYGAVDYLYKPIQEDLLLGKIKVFLDLYDEKVKHQQAKEQFQAILNAATEGILGIDGEGIIHFSNPSAERLLRYNKNQTLIGVPFVSLLFLNDPVTLTWEETPIHLCCQKGQIYHSDDVQFIRRNGEHFPTEYTANALSRDPNDGVVLVFNDISVRKAFEEQLTSMAMYDYLTQLPNRLFFEKTLSQSISRSSRNNSLMAVFFLDLDKFKQVNDNLGHDMGDALLKAFANRLRDCLRSSDTVARLGGDEFAIILDPIAHQEDASLMAEKIIAAAREPYKFGETEVLNSTSIGISVFPISGTSSDALVKNADMAMYKAKQAGSNSYFYFTDTMHEQGQRKEELILSLRQAIASNEFTFHYQPTLNLKSKAVEYIEALLRWEHKSYGNISPLEFIPLAEEAGLIFELGEKLLSTIITTIKPWYEGKYFSGRVVFNVSANQLLRTDLVKLFKLASQKFEFPLNHLAIDITEESLMQYNPNSLTMIQDMNALGMQININNFGSSFSSLNLLRRLPLTILKLDRNFIRSTLESTNEIQILRALITLGHSLNFSLMAEGIESKEQIQILKEQHCDYIQGYAFSPPLMSDGILDFLKSHQ